MDNEALINGYFEGTLSKIERETFDRLLETDTAFAADFEFEQTLQRSLKKQERKDIKEMLSGLNLADDKVETKVFRLRPWLVAASIVLLLGISSWLVFFNNPTLNTDQLYTLNFMPYENVVHPIERGEQLEDLKTRAFTAYEDADYGLALKLFKELQVQQNDPYIDFYKAIVLMQLNEHNGAIDLLKKYIANNGQLKDRATWYLALAYLKRNDIAESKAELEKLIEQSGYKREAAIELLEEINP